VLEAAGFDLALLLVETDAAVGLLIGRHAAIAIGGSLNGIGRSG